MTENFFVHELSHEVDFAKFGDMSKYSSTATTKIVFLSEVNAFKNTALFALEKGGRNWDVINMTIPSFSEKILDLHTPGKPIPSDKIEKLEEILIDSYFNQNRIPLDNQIQKCAAVLANKEGGLLSYSDYYKLNLGTNPYKSGKNPSDNEIINTLGLEKHADFLKKQEMFYTKEDVERTLDTKEGKDYKPLNKYIPKEVTEKQIGPETFMQLKRGNFYR